MEKLEFKGTKGEWYYDEFVNGVKCDSVDGLLATAWGTYNSSEHEIREDGESWLSMRKRTEPIRSKCSEEQIANAKLIAAAPILLKEHQMDLKHLLTWKKQLLDAGLKSSVMYQEYLDMIEAKKKAIEKALK